MGLMGATRARSMSALLARRAEEGWVVEEGGIKAERPKKIRGRPVPSLKERED